MGRRQLVEKRQGTGIRRKISFSPNHVENALAILRLTAREIEKQGFSVSLIEESELETRSVETPVIFNMCQGAPAIRVLQKIEESGKLVINSPGSILNTYFHFLVF